MTMPVLKKDLVDGMFKKSGKKCAARYLQIGVECLTIQARFINLLFGVVA